jgi:hypothetical protein
VPSSRGIGALSEEPDEYSGVELAPPRIVTPPSLPEDDESLRVVRRELVL